MPAGSTHGFTLLDLLIGTTLLALVFAIATPSLSDSAEAHRLRAAARATSGYVRAVRATAVARNREARLTLADGGTTLRTEVLEAGVWADAAPGLTLDGVRVTTIAPGPTLGFSRQGVASAPSTIRLATSRGAAVDLPVSILGAVGGSE